MKEVELHFFDGKAEVWVGDSDHIAGQRGVRVLEIPDIQRAELVVVEGGDAKHWCINIRRRTSEANDIFLDEKSKDELSLLSGVVNLK